MQLPASTADFSDPLGILAACHTRIESQCMTLLRLPAYLGEHGNDAAVREAAAKVIRYFETAGRHHHQDEEQNLFPLLIARADASQRALIGNLIAQHQDLDAAWCAFKPLLAALAEGGAVSEALPVERFAALYRAHINEENTRLLPFARAVLSVEELRTLGDNMARRRGIRISEDISKN